MDAGTGTATTSGLGQRYLPISWIRQRWEDGETTTIGLQNRADVALIINPREHYLGLRVGGAGIDSVDDRIGIADLRNVSLRKTGSHVVCEVLTSADGLSVAYYFLRNIAVLIQEHGQAPLTAIRDSVNGFRALLEGVKLGSQASEVGLLGEIAVLRLLVDDCGLPLAEAVAAWLGPDAEEHDFAFAHCDIEVKATSSERRRHKITSRAQLTETLGKRLLLASVQLTKTSAGGETLVEAVDKLRQSLTDDTMLALLDTRLSRAGVIPETRHVYSTRWLLRTEIEFYEVDDEFPRILGAFDQRISDISYSVDVGGLPALSLAEIAARVKGAK